MLIGLAALALLVSAGELSDWRQEQAMMDSLSRVHPRFRADWLEERGIRDEYWQGCIVPQDSGLRCIGRWSYGPSYDVDGRVTPSETLVALARGSGVSLLRFSRQDSPTIELLADVNAGGIMKRVSVRDSLLYVGSAAGLEIWSITDERNPVQRAWVHTALNDFAVQDSFAYVIGPDDSFKVYNVANPVSPTFRGACRDSGNVLAVAGSTAFLGDRWGLYLLDVANPATPHRVGTWGSPVEGISARRKLCYVTTFNPNTPGDIEFRILNVTNPASPQPIGLLDQAGGFDVHLIDTLAFCSGDQYTTEFEMVSVADSTQPRLIGSGVVPGDNWGVWANGDARSAFVAARHEGMSVFDVAVPSAPVRDTAMLAADMARDIDIQGSLAAVADYDCGLMLLDVLDPARPRMRGQYDTLGILPLMESAVLADSFAFVSWPVERVQSVSVADPTRPTRAGVCPGMFAPPSDMVLRDSFLYCAEMRRLQVVNVARPRSPVLVGSCLLPDASRGMCLQDTLAYVTNAPLKIVNVRDPAHPAVIGQIDRGAYNIFLRDTLAYLADWNGLFTYSVANISLPYLIDSIGWGTDVFDVVAVGSLAYVGCRDGLRLLSVADPREPRVLAFEPTPYLVWRLSFVEPHVYAACSEAGVCVFETTQVGIQEAVISAPPAFSPGVWPNPTNGLLHLLLGDARSGRTGICIRDATGRLVLAAQSTAQPSGACLVDIGQLSPGVYFVESCSGMQGRTVKVIKR